MWESESRIIETSTCVGTTASSQKAGKCSRNGSTGRQQITHRPAVIRTTWLDFTGDGNNMFGSVDNQNMTTVVAEHTEWKSAIEAKHELNMSEHFNDTTSLNNNYQDVYAHNQNETSVVGEEEEEEEEEAKLFPLTPKIKSKTKRVFQKFWCAADEDDEDLQELPRPDGYRLRSCGSQKRNNKSSLKRKLLGIDNRQLVVSDEIPPCTNDERGGIRRRPKTWDFLENEDIKRDAKFYAPKRPPPILDFLMVVTSFLAAAVLAYYSAT